MKFKPGQKLVCTVSSGGNWIKNINIHQLSYLDRLKLLLKGNKVLGPGFNEVVTVARVEQDCPGYVPLVEYQFGPYDDRWFEPLVKRAVIERELSEIFESQKN